jgi:sulfate-transporting ATPase
VSGLVLAVALGIFGYGIIKSTRPRPQEIRYAIDEAETGGRDPATLVVENLTVRYGSVAAVDGLDLTVSPGQIVGLIGPNGAGKTTAIDAITGFIAPADGTVTLGGRQLDEMRVHLRSDAGLGRTFQTVEPFDDLTVAENLAAATERLGVPEWLMSFLRVPHLSLDSLTGRVIDAFDLHSELGHFPSELPQGRRRLLGVARALAANPAVLLLDEPAAGLDAAETRALGEQLRRVANESNVGMLLVEHDMSIVKAICDEVIAMDFGKTIFRGTAPDAMEHAGVRASYLGVEVEQAGEPA